MGHVCTCTYVYLLYINMLSISISLYVCKFTTIYYYFYYYIYLFNSSFYKTTFYNCKNNFALNLQLLGAFKEKIDMIIK